ncbi:MYO9A protein, partial [Ramphastos sulfuratus]|nr:MYO9A protein [Ramphastos sulfuratus]
RPQRAKMRFWVKGKQGEKKTSREKLATQSELLELYAEQEAPGREVISGLQLGEVCGPEGCGEVLVFAVCRQEESACSHWDAWGTAAAGQCCCIPAGAVPQHRWGGMHKGLLVPQMNELENEDSKKDTLVDVVFKKALKEFRQNIFSFYSSALAMDDGKSIRYKDLYALFEQILEKTMRLEQRDWSESPVKVWVNTFKVFLDEYMIEYKPLDYTALKVGAT